MRDESCPQEEELRDCLVGKLPVDAAETLFGHLDTYPRCQAKLPTVSDVGDTLIDCLRPPWVRDEFLDEPQFQEAVARARAIGEAMTAAARRSHFLKGLRYETDSSNRCALIASAPGT